MFKKMEILENDKGYIVRMLSKDSGKNFSKTASIEAWVLCVKGLHQIVTICFTHSNTARFCYTV